MDRIRGWGWLLALALPLLVFFSWSQLGSSASRINLERYENSGGGDASRNEGELVTFFKRTRKLPVAGDIALPPIPPKSGIKAWSLEPDGIYKVEIDAKIDGRAVVLQFVPIVRKGGLIYDCVSSTSAVHVRKFCMTYELKSVDDIPAQLQANLVAMKNLPAMIGATGEAVPAGVLTGQALVAPENLAALNNCGYQCVKPLSCANERPLLCVKIVDEGNARWQEFSATSIGYRGTNIANEAQANTLCEQALGTGWGVAQASNLSGKPNIAGSSEYWVHDNANRQGNCWPAS
jgi:hypothetical protein